VERVVQAQSGDWKDNIPRGRHYRSRRLSFVERYGVAYGLRRAASTAAVLRLLRAAAFLAVYLVWCILQRGVLFSSSLGCAGVQRIQDLLLVGRIACRQNGTSV